MLDAWRGIAILLVLAAHCDRALTGGWLGVHLFFVLSGFLITALLLNEHQVYGRIDLASFYRRRALRLFPALLAMLIAYLVVMVARTAVGQSGDLEHSLLGVAFGASYLVNIVLAIGDLRRFPTSFTTSGRSVWRSSSTWSGRFCCLRS